MEFEEEFYSYDTDNYNTQIIDDNTIGEIFNTDDIAYTKIDESKELDATKDVNKKIRSNQDLLKGFHNAIQHMGFFNQREIEEIRTSMIDNIKEFEYNHYEILIPTFYILSYCIKNRISFSESIISTHLQEIYTKKSCLERMRQDMYFFGKQLGCNCNCSNELDYYIRGFILIIRSIMVDQGMQNISQSPFLSNLGGMLEMYEDIKYEAYCIFAVGIKYNCFNEISMERIFDSMVKLLISIMFKREIISTNIIERLEKLYESSTLNQQLSKSYEIEKDVSTNINYDDITSLRNMYKLNIC
jgi:hypothetical protein